MDSQVKKADNGGGSFFSDCSICWDLGNEPVLTCCGHLFCWACFYRVPYFDSTSKECPVCRGKVSVSTIIPIYGDGGNKPACETLKIPPRPGARRVEIGGQQGVTRYLSHVLVAEISRVISECAASLSSAFSSAERLVGDLKQLFSIHFHQMINKLHQLTLGVFTRPSAVLQTDNLNAALPIAAS